ncbi:anti-sigma factor domain-containing protein [Mesobacillus jeotgali]|uniref:anti-sigma factor domain-containing protein n=1 Tax=Mesobacillus jeotgali TaxID=129985 RepID=UPI0009A90A64|nr:anti-sigma factor domain-containing protein [Mesobacillus jeotgali]
MKKGVILEINDLYLTLLTPEGEFLRARKHQQDYQVGEEIHFFPETEAVKRKRFGVSILNSFKARAIVLAAVLMLVMTSFLPVYENGQVYAYMSIDVNPSIEMSINDDLRVLQMKGYNPEGKQIIAEIEGWEKKDAALVAEMVIDKIEAKGYFKNKNDVVIATIPNSDSKESVDRKLENKIAEIKKTTSEENLNLKVMEATREDREKAIKQGLTTGLYKEKQKVVPAPSVKPVENEKKDKPEPEKQEPTQKPVKQEPQKKEAPGQTKKENPGEQKGNSGQQGKPSPEKNKEDKNSGMNNNGHTSDKHAYKGNKNAAKPNQHGPKYKNEKNPNANQHPKGNQKGQAGNGKGNNNNK